MAETIATMLIQRLEPWLQRVESMEENKSNDAGLIAMHGLAVGVLLTQTTLIVQVIGTNSERWKEVAELMKQQDGRYKSQAVKGCLDLLKSVAKLFVPKE